MDYDLTETINLALLLSLITPLLTILIYKYNLHLMFPARKPSLLQHHTNLIMTSFPYNANLIMTSFSYNETGLEEPILITYPKQYFITDTCTQCFKPRPDLKACSNCHLVFYCSKKCQKEDHTNHKPLCNALLQINYPNKSKLYDNIKARLELGEPWVNIISQTLHDLTQKLGTLTRMHYKIITLQKACEICRESHPALLKPCTTCYTVFYCNKNHQKEDSGRHRDLCSTFRLSTKCDLYQAQAATRHNTLPFTELSFLDFPTPIPHTNYEKLPRDMLYLLPTPVYHNTAIASEWLSTPLTALYALEMTNSKRNNRQIQNYEEISILIIPRTQFQTKNRNATAWEYILHRLPSLRRLQIVTLDPNLVTITGQQADHINLVIPLCDRCQKEGKLLLLTAESHLKDCSKDYAFDLALSYGGLDWSNPKKEPLPEPNPSLKMVMTNTFIDLLKSDLNRLSNTEEHVTLLQPQVNPYASQRPERLHFYTSHNIAPSTSTEPLPKTTCFGYTNKYISILRRKTKKHQDQPKPIRLPH